MSSVGYFYISGKQKRSPQPTKCVIDLRDLAFQGVEPHATDMPLYDPSILLKIYVYGYLNRVQSSRRL